MLLLSGDARSHLGQYYKLSTRLNTIRIPGHASGSAYLLHTKET